MKTVSVKNRVMCFTTGDLQSNVAEYNQYCTDFQEQQEVVVTKILEIVSTYYPILETTSGIISELDVLCGFAQLASENSSTYCKHRNPSSSSSVPSAPATRR